MRYETGRCRLVECLALAGMTQQQLADKIPMDKRQISRYATGDIKGMSLLTAVTIAEAIGCNPKDLFEWVPIKPTKRQRGNP